MARVTTKIVAKGKGTRFTVRIVDVAPNYPGERTIQHWKDGPTIAYPVAEAYKVGSEFELDGGVDFGGIGNTVVVTVPPYEGPVSGTA